MTTFYIWNGSARSDTDDYEPQSLLENKLQTAKSSQGPSLLLSDDQSHLVDDLLKEIEPYSHSILLDSFSFASLTDPNAFNYRFLGLFGDNRAFFEFFDSDDEAIRIGKKDFRTAFEESLFHFYSGEIERSYAGLINITKVFPQDTAARQYLDKCRQQLGGDI